MEARWPIGTKFKTRGKHPKDAEVVDILKTYNNSGELVRIRYVAVTYTMGQPVYDYDVPDTTIARSKI